MSPRAGKWLRYMMGQSLTTLIGYPVIWEQSLRPLTKSVLFTILNHSRFILEVCSKMTPFSLLSGSTFQPRLLVAETWTQLRPYLNRSY